jgi:hypothetical protein
MALKLNNLWNTWWKEKALMAIPRVCNVNEYYMNKEFLHAKNERFYVATRKDTILKQVCHIAIGERKGKVVQFYVCFHIFEGTPR